MCIDMSVSVGLGTCEHAKRVSIHYVVEMRGIQGLCATASLAL